jgi:hypothetical protein
VSHVQIHQFGRLAEARLVQIRADLTRGLTAYPTKT